MKFDVDLWRNIYIYLQGIIDIQQRYILLVLATASGTTPHEEK
jgi:hypothetical protein